MQKVKLQFEQTSDYRAKEAFKTLRSNIEFCGGDVKVITVTSCTPNEGKSSIAMEMARAFAEAGNRTICSFFPSSNRSTYTTSKK